jgi:hypothetical protein
VEHITRAWVSTMNKAQQIDYAQHAHRLLLLITRRDKLPPGSDLIAALDIEMRRDGAEEPAIFRTIQLVP